MSKGKKAADTVAQESKTPPGADVPVENPVKTEAPPAAVAPAPASEGEDGQPVLPLAESTSPAPDELTALKGQMLRLQADFDNFRKRTARERSETVLRANEDLMMAMLPVLDHLDLALAAALEHKAEGAVVQGFKIVADQLQAILGKFGLAPVDATGQAFDANAHEAVLHMPSADVPENGVVSQVRRGYRLGAKLLRPVQVAVSSGPAAPPEAAPAAPKPED